MRTIRYNTLLFLAIFLSFSLSGCGPHFSDAYKISMGSPPPLVATCPTPPASSDVLFGSMLKAGVDAANAKPTPSRLAVVKAVTDEAANADAKDEAASSKPKAASKSKAAAIPFVPFCSMGADGEKISPYKFDENRLWRPTPCQAFIVQAAVNHCIKRTRETMYSLITADGLLLVAGYTFTSPTPATARVLTLGGGG